MSFLSLCREGILRMIQRPEVTNFWRLSLKSEKGLLIQEEEVITSSIMCFLLRRRIQEESFPKPQISILKGSHKRLPPSLQLGLSKNLLITAVEQKNLKSLRKVCQRFKLINRILIDLRN